MSNDALDAVDPGCEDFKLLSSKVSAPITDQATALIFVEKVNDLARQHRTTCRRCQEYAPSPASGDRSIDSHALAITVALASVVAVAALAPSAVLGPVGFRIIRGLICTACVVVALRRRRVLTSAELWILANLVMLYNPLYEFWLFERERWIWIDVAAAAALSAAVHRSHKPGRSWNASVWAFLLGVYVSSLVGEHLVADGAPGVGEMLALPVSLAAATWIASMLAVLVASPFLPASSWFRTVRERLRKRRQRDPARAANT